MREGRAIRDDHSRCEGGGRAWNTSRCLFSTDENDTTKRRPPPFNTLRPSNRGGLGESKSNENLNPIFSRECQHRLFGHDIYLILHWPSNSALRRKYLLERDSQALLAAESCSMSRSERFTARRSDCWFVVKFFGRLSKCNFKTWSSNAKTQKHPQPS